MRGLLKDTLAELIDRKMLYLFGGVTVVAVLIATVGAQIDVGFHTGSGVDSEADPFKAVVGSAAVRGLSTFMSFMVFLATMATAGLIPQLLTKGRVDFYLSKPVSRTGLLLGKLFSTIIVYGLLITLCGSVLSLALKWLIGGFGWEILGVFPISVAALCIWLCIVFLAGVAFKSTPLAIMTTFLVWIVQTVLSGHEAYKQLLDSKTADIIIDSLYYIFPKMTGINDMSRELALGGTVFDWMPLWSSLLFGIAMIWLAALTFRKTDF
ncbi:MAG: hypothetical protein DRP45_05995 [Candidatus Zixiibacteriota bacterium]|nr:MAG: hypothetical protein DRP45_05995 [candidate division Zixibacteria bacterium]